MGPNKRRPSGIRPRLAAKRKSSRQRHSGQAATEFLIVFFVILFFVCSILQLALIFVARSAVDYASFCAARAAIVWYHKYPDSRDLRGPTQALEMARRAAAIATLPISGRLSGGGSQEPTAACFEALAVVNTRMKSWADRYRMSSAATEVSFVQGTGAKPGQPLTVRVVYWYRLYLPLVNRILGYQGAGATGLTGYYLPITASCTLDVE
ncbi:MAG: pilus assembly protein [Armatimonadetes bacterium]|nr:pilus assembly protein [Armatimonadota bacterium]